MTFKVADTGGVGLSQLVTDLHLDQANTQGKELRSKGDDLYVKNKVARHTNLESRTNHRRDAIANVTSSLAHEYHLTPQQAQQVMRNVFGGGLDRITGGDVKRLDEIGQQAAALLNANMDPVQAFEVARVAHDSQVLQDLGVPAPAANLAARFMPVGAMVTAMEKGDLGELRRLVDNMPSTVESVHALEVLEAVLIQKADANDISQPALTKPVHEVFFRKKTEVLEEAVHRELQNSDDPRLGTLKSMPKDQYWKLLIDGKMHNHGDKHAYDRSRGYMASMMNGLLKVVSDIDTPLSPQFVKDLHQLSVRHVTNESAAATDDRLPLQGSKFQESGLKQAANAWGVCKSFTPEGMNELQDLREELDGVIEGGYFSEDAMRFTDKPDTVVQWRAGKQGQPRLGQDVEALMKHVIDKAYESIELVPDQPDLIIGAIVDCCRGLSIIHPFKDANGRLMNFLILNKLLVEHGLPPTTLEDQGLMVGRSKQELVDLIKQGQQATLQVLA